MKIKKRPIVMNKKTSGCDKQQRKRSLKHVNFIKKFKKRRHLSTHIISSWTKRKSKRRSSLNNVITKKNNSNGNSRTSRRSSYHRYIFPSEINLPNWERISPNIDKILSDEHTKSGVYAHEIHLIQQELEALLSMSLVRENLLQSTNIDNRNSRIQQHQQAEYIYSSKNIPNKPLINHQQRNNSPHVLHDRQLSITPIADARIDTMWSDIDSYYREISSNDISSIKTLVYSNQKLKEKIVKCKNDYITHKLPKSSIAEQLNKETYPDLLNTSQINPLITQYTNQTIIERVQTKLYEYASSVRQTPKSHSSNGRSSLRSSSRLQTDHRKGRFPIQNLKSDSNDVQSSIIKGKNNVKTLPNSSTLSKKLQNRIQLVHDYLTDQHPLSIENKKHKSSKRIKNGHCKDMFESKLSTLASLLQECSSLSSCALERAHLQSNNEKTWGKLNGIQQDLESLIQKIEMTGDYNNNISTKKTLRTLDHLLKNWKKCEDDFDHQFEQLFSNYV
ncbi:unnamed protein product [Rotaria socialis]|uniref:Uncharacterized protein n=1 Tax=Rotaria socialis TaxID=392032 RepID=A0A817W945_9BILA|nr:unnamed protein product [Rotaria socialis]